MAEKMYQNAVRKLKLEELTETHRHTEWKGDRDDKFYFNSEALIQDASQFAEKMDQQEREIWWQNVRAVLGIARFVNINEAGQSQMPKYHPSRGRY